MLELGPFNTELGYMNVDIDGEYALDIYPELDDDIIKMYRLDLGADMPESGERTITNHKLVLKWKAEAILTGSGIDSIRVKLLGLTGTIDVEDLPYGADHQDPDVEVETFKYKVNISESDLEAWKIRIDYSEETVLNQAKEPYNLLIDFKHKHITLDI